MNSSAQTPYTLKDLCYLMERLRDPKTGCPWDIKQTFLSITPSTIEEAYETVDAIARGDRSEICEELGDLLFQVVFYSQLAKEEQAFDLNTVVNELTAKLIRRHPHVFPDGSLDSIREQDIDEHAIKAQWESIKAEERKSKGKTDTFADIPSGLPAITRAQKIQKRAAVHQFDWSGYAPVFDKIQEEIAELQSAVSENDKDGIHDELGDVLFSVVNLARHLKVDPESALRHANAKFTLRFKTMQALLNENHRDLCDLAPDELDALWQSAKLVLSHQ